jgi:hypothetical protein
VAQEQYAIRMSVCQYKSLLTDLYRGRDQRRCSFRIKTFQIENVETLGAGYQPNAAWFVCAIYAGRVSRRGLTRTSEQSVTEAAANFTVKVRALRVGRE